jgi:type I restriction enzyme S subunit
VTDGWATVRVADVAAPGPNSMSTGPFGSSIGSKYFRPSGVPVIRGGNLSTTSAVRLSDDNLVFLDPDKAAEFSRSTVGHGDLVFTCWGTINQVGLIDDTAKYEKYIISNKQMKLTPDPSVADSEFLYYLFSAPRTQRQILEGSIGSSIPGFNLTRLKSLEIELPPLSEQRHIAKALSDAERVETQLGMLISKKKAIKQAMTQQLLTGRVRLPGFEGPRTDGILSGYATGLRGAGLSKELLRASGLYPCVLYGELFTTYGRRIDRVRSRTNEPGGVLSQMGDVLVPGSTTTISRDLATASAIHLSGVFLGGDINIIRPGPALDSDWLAHYITHRLQDRIAEVAQGLTIKHLYVRDLLECPIVLPSVAEQRAIVAALMDAEAVIAVLRRRHQKAREVKSGMMQELLSGGTRLPVAERTA